MALTSHRTLRPPNNHHSGSRFRHFQPTQYPRHPERSAAKPKDPEGIDTNETARTFNQESRCSAFAPV